MKVIYLGTPEFAVKPLESVIKSGIHEVVAVVCQPDRPVGRKAVITPPPTKVVAEKYGIPVLQYEKIRNGGAEELKKFNADIMVTCAYGQILTKDILDVCKFGVINIHASLLPKYRGAAPIQYAIVCGETETGVTFMKTEEGLDTGDIIRAYKTEIKECETSAELAERLSDIGAEHINEVLSSIENGEASYTKQDDSLANVVRTIKKENTVVDFKGSGKETANFINGMYPLAYSFCKGKKYKFYRAKQAGDFPDGNKKAKAGEVIFADKRLIVSCGSSAVEILELQEEGGKRLAARDFLNGRKILAGDVFSAGNNNADADENKKR